MKHLQGVKVWLVGLGAAVSADFACGPVDFLKDPLHRAEVEALGPEAPGVTVGTLHRPGQPCAACHRPDGLAEPYVAAGTVYRDPLTTVGVADAEVVLIDAAGNTFTTKTNCVGNFYVKVSEFRPVLPFWTSVQLGEFPFLMASPIHREASCTKCHFDPVGPGSAGHVFVTDDQTTIDTVPVRPCEPQDQVVR